MKRFYVSNNIEVNKNIIVDGIEHNHIKNVMRMNVGDEVILVCGDEFDYFATITKITKGDTTLFVTRKEENIYNPNSDVTVFQALVKTDNMSLIVQKLNELGVKYFVPFESEFITSKDKYGKTGKLQEVANQSVKQCKRSIPMLVSETLTFAQMTNKLQNYDIIIFANECEKTFNLSSLSVSDGQKVAIIVGSEGGFSEKEIDVLTKANAKSISLGKRILRAETASIALTSVVMFLLGEWNYE